MTMNLIPFGLLELDATGRVLLYEPVNPSHAIPSPKSILGRNFFTEVVPFSQMRGLQHRFNAFVDNDEEEQRFVLSLPYNHGQVKIRFLLARFTRKVFHGFEGMAIIQISPDGEEV
ncbi:MAG: hypothetical protein H0T45_11920 [Pyrinomonadaceae bacterium]|nr:hypothetical protein [Pyrinomonadaceae bacterium]